MNRPQPMGEVVQAEQVAVVATGDVDVQVSTAQQYPRNVAQVVQEVRDIALLDRATSLGCMYFVPRAGKFIEGYSIRFAEIVASSWRHLRIQSESIARVKGGAKGSAVGHVVCRATCWDLQSNTAWAKEVSRLVYGNEWELAESNAQATAARDAILKTVPQGVLRSVRDEIRETILGDSRDLPHYLERLLRWLKDEHAVTQQEVEKFLGAGGRPVPRKDWTAELAFVLGATVQNIRDGERAAAEVFGKATKARGAKKVEPLEKAEPAIHEPEDTHADLVRQVRALEKSEHYVATLDSVGAFPMDLGASTAEQLGQALELLKLATVVKK